jgi:hypothetical protein
MSTIDFCPEQEKTTVCPIVRSNVAYNNPSLKYRTQLTAAQVREIANFNE